MDRNEIEKQIDQIRAETDEAAEKLRQAVQVEVECTNGWALQALAEKYTDRLKVLAKDYEVDVTPEVIRGVWLASQLVLDLDPEMMLADA